MNQSRRRTILQTTSPSGPSQAALDRVAQVTEIRERAARNLTSTSSSNAVAFPASLEVIGNRQVAGNLGNNGIEPSNIVTHQAAGSSAISLSPSLRVTFSPEVAMAPSSLLALRSPLLNRRRLTPAMGGTFQSPISQPGIGDSQLLVSPLAPSPPLRLQSPIIGSGAAQERRENDLLMMSY